MAKISNRWDYLAIAAIVLAVVGLAVYINPAAVGEGRFENPLNLSNPCAKDEAAVLDEEYLLTDGTDASVWYCFKQESFSPKSLPLAGVFGVAAILLLVLRLRPTSTARR